MKDTTIETLMALQEFCESVFTPHGVQPERYSDDDDEVTPEELARLNFTYADPAAVLALIQAVNNFRTSVAESGFYSAIDRELYY